MAALAIPLAVASTLMVSIRLWSRFTRQAGKLGIDDMFIVASWVSNQLSWVVPPAHEVG